MYQFINSSTSTTTETYFADPNTRFSNEFGNKNLCNNQPEHTDGYQQQNSIDNNGGIAFQGFSNTDEPATSNFFPRFDEFGEILNSEEFREICKQEPSSLQQQEGEFLTEEGTAQDQAQLQQQQPDQQHFQQVNSAFLAPESLRAKNNNNISVNITKATEPTSDFSGNIGYTNGFSRPVTDEQESLLTPQVQLDNEEGHRSQYFNRLQQIKESIYLETKSFIYDNYNPIEATNNMASHNLHQNQQQLQLQQHRQQSKIINYNGASYLDTYDNMTKQERPYVEIVEQPAKCSLRFRYKCEGRSAGSLPGINSSADNKTYPSIQIKNYTGRAVVVISCVTKDAPYLTHPHNIVGKEGCKKGTCTVVFNNDPHTVRSFSSIGIQCVKRKDIEESLSLRESIHVDPFRNGFAHKLNSSNIDLNVVRLCFQVFIEGSTPNKYDVPLIPVVSEPIHDKKAMSDLVITKLSHCAAPATGGREIILLCDRISRDDIQVRFFEEREGKLLWETYTELAPTDVHKQVAICFKTPKYFNENITQPVTANIQLKRLSDNQVSEPRMFKFLPCESDEDMISRKRQKIHQLNSNFHHHINPHHHHYQHQQQPPARVVLGCQDSPFQQHPGSSSASPHSRIASPVTPVQASSPAAQTILDKQIQQQGHSPTPAAPTNNHPNQSNQQSMQDQNTYMIEQLQQQQREQQNSVVRGEIIDDDGKVVRLVDRPSHQPLARANSSNRNAPGDGGRETTNQQRQQEDNNKAQLGLSLARIDSDQLMRADMAFNSNMNLDLGSSISIHLNGGGTNNGNGNVTTNNDNQPAPLP